MLNTKQRMDKTIYKHCEKWSVSALILCTESFIPSAIYVCTKLDASRLTKNSLEVIFYSFLCMWSLYDESEARVWVHIYGICAMCCAEHPIQAAKQTVRQPNEKAQNTQRAVRRAKQQSRERNIVQIGRVLHRAMNKHDPAHTWTRTTGALHKHRARNLKKKGEERCVCVCYLSSCASWVAFYFRFWKRWVAVCVMAAIRPVLSGFSVWLCRVLCIRLREICCGKLSVHSTSPTHSPCTGCQNSFVQFCFLLIYTFVNWTAPKDKFPT